MPKFFDFNDADFITFLKELLNSCLYERNDGYDEEFAGIARRAIDSGWNSLSEKQQQVIKIRIDQICPDRCSVCGDSLPWCEMQFALEHDGQCTHCAKVWSEIEKD